ncbi:3-oxoadipate enol-lactonase [Histidinibacterium lentulum]|uniref:3-oxoadipate enol-lactonase n=1 Tax=Histidinibacterium lentulum TaxID=2480588 RepID=A0A3N2QS96_9RHOB|nr:3-oxoadipate enol-lactonase [Histidinibacterium lentulum]ROT98083.1 3-oxoadipate enol-lactonase [Histidinibacterium lentulum]
MTEHLIRNGDVTLRAQIDGSEDADATPVMFVNGLCSTLESWDGVVAQLPPVLRVVRYDLRGHGRSDVTPAPYAMGALIADAERVADVLDVRGAAVVGLSLGGLIAQGLAVKRPDIVRTLVLSNTGAKIGTRDLWEERIAKVRTHGLATLADEMIDRWVSPGFRGAPEVAELRRRILGTAVEGYCGCAAAIAGTDFLTATSGLRLTTLCIAGSEDRATPPDMLQELAGLIPGARFELIRRAGHLPHLEQPEAFADLLIRFLSETGDLPGRA